MIISMLAALGYLASTAMAEPAPEPYEQKHACLIDCCSYKKKWEWELLAPKLLKDKPNGKKVDQLHKGETVRAVDGSVLVQPWQWTVRQKTEGFKERERFQVLGPSVDDMVPVRIRGHIRKIKEDFICAAVGKGETPKREECLKMLVKGPQTKTWWAKVRHQDGRKGWIRVDQSELKIPDLCNVEEAPSLAMPKEPEPSPSVSPQPN
jgi:hypothetical protein